MVTSLNSIDLPTEQEIGLTPEQLQSVIEPARDTREDYTPKTPILFPGVSYLG